MIPFSTRSSIAILRVMNSSIPLIFPEATASNISGCIPLYAAVPIQKNRLVERLCEEKKKNLPVRVISRISTKVILTCGDSSNMARLRYTPRGRILKSAESRPA